MKHSIRLQEPTLGLAQEFLNLKTRQPFEHAPTLTHDNSEEHERAHHHLPLMHMPPQNITASHLYCLSLIERHLRYLRTGASSRTGAPAGGAGVLLTFGLHGDRIPGAQAERDSRPTSRELETKSG